ncbi:MAG: histidine phosphatase family protein [Bacilli bacterium]|nr:histidine phosphatase family protein [Bacilli bacterium]
MLYVVRHGKTDSNENGRYGGRIDVNLNEEGIRQAEEVALKLKDIKFEKVFSSPLSRAYKTAEIICKGKYDIIKDERIIERSNGKLEGKL